MNKNGNKRNYIRNCRLRARHFEHISKQADRQTQSKSTKQQHTEKVGKQKKMGIKFLISYLEEDRERAEL